MPDIRHSIQIAAPLDAVYALAATAGGFKQWWAEDVTQINDKVELAFFNRNTIYRLAPVSLAAPNRAEWKCETGAEWAGTRLVFKLDPTKTGTLLRFTHADWAGDTDYFVACTTTWGELMFRLAAAAEGKGRGPLFLKSSLAY